MLSRSPRGAFSSTAASASFSEGTDSPVRADSSLFRPALFKSRASAGTKSPASSRMMSPGTRPEASMTCSAPSRSTRAWGADMFFRASRAFSAFDSCTTPSTALSTTMSRIRAGSKNSMGVVAEAGHHKAHRRRQQQDDDHHVLELLQKPLEVGLLLALTQFVGAELPLQLRHLGGREPSFGV